MQQFPSQQPHLLLSIFNKIQSSMLLGQKHALICLARRRMPTGPGPLKARVKFISGLAVNGPSRERLQFSLI